LFEGTGDLVEGFSGETGGNLSEGEDWVGFSNLFELSEDGSVGGFWGNTGEFFEDEVEGTDNFFSLGGSGGIGEGVSFSFSSKGDFSVIEDFQLFGLVVDVVAKVSDFTGQKSDFGFSVVSLNGGNIDSSVEFGDLGITLDNLSGVEVISFVVLEGEVLSDFS